MDIREIISITKRQGWAIKKGKKHYRLTPPMDNQSGTQIISATPSDYRAIENIRAQLRRAGVIFPSDKHWEAFVRAQKHKGAQEVKMRQQERQELGRRVADYRTTHGFSQTDLAKILNISKGTVSNIETARNTCRYETFEAIAQLLGYSDGQMMALELGRAALASSKKPKAELTLDLANQPAELAQTTTITEVADQIQTEVEKIEQSEQPVVAPAENSDEDRLIDEALKLLEHLDEHFAGWEQLVKIIDTARDLVVDGQSLGIVLSNRECAKLKALAAKFGR